VRVKIAIRPSDFKMNEKRNSQRSRTLKGGTISFGGGGAIDCTIRNLSSTGANLEVVSPVGIPDDFTLVIRPDHTQHSCRVAWRRQNRIGVAFKKCRPSDVPHGLRGDSPARDGGFQGGVATQVRDRAPKLSDLGRELINVRGLDCKVRCTPDSDRTYCGAAK
jgi:PilZ domain